MPEEECGPLPTKRQYDGWTILKELGQGANGVVYLVEREDGGVKKGVLKFGLNIEGATTLAFEKVVMEALVAEGLQEPRTQHVVKIVASGITEYKIENVEKKMPYVVMEMLPDNCIELIGEVANDAERTSVICDFALQILKGIYDLHTAGFIHRDLKPENIGMFQKTLAVIYDMGMCRNYLDENGELRIPRSYNGMRGTEEWSSLNAENGCDLGRVDDLWGWLYLINEYVNCTSAKPQAWTALDGHTNLRLFLKSYKFPAGTTLANCPFNIFRAMAYVRCLAPTDTPNYFYLASLVFDAKRDTKRCQRGAATDPTVFLSEMRYMDNNLFF